MDFVVEIVVESGWCWVVVVTLVVEIEKPTRKPLIVKECTA